MIGFIIIIAVIGLAVLIFKGLSQAENTSANDVRASQPGHYHDSSCDAEDSVELRFHLLDLPDTQLPQPFPECLLCS